ncbi:MAG: 16S rRNA processing protein RimM [Clostridia bacterium]|nr:16S rRNA processing protein RimM [Clostridia bacterium]
MLDYLTIGEIVNVHGVRGEVKVLPSTDDPGRFKLLKQVRIVRDGSVCVKKVTGAKVSSGMAILALEGVTTRDDAEKLRGSFLEVERKDALKLPEDRWYIGDIVGCSVYEEDGTCLGKVTDVGETGSNDYYVVRDEKNREMCIPALKEVLLDVDVVEQKITVRLLPGLKEVYYEN